MRRDAIESALTLGRDALSHMWRDELGDLFILTKRLEAYAFSKTVLGCYCWHRKTYLLLKKRGGIFNDVITDDRIRSFRINKENLPLLLSLGAFKRRPDKEGQWIKDKERRLGHRIRPLTAEQKTLLRAEFAKVARVGGQEELALICEKAAVASGPSAELKMLTSEVLQ